MTMVISLRWFVGFCWIKADWGSHYDSMRDWKHLEPHAAWPQCSGRRHGFHCCSSTWMIVLGMHRSAFYAFQQFVALMEMSTAVIVTAVLNLTNSSSLCLRCQRKKTPNFQSVFCCCLVTTSKKFTYWVITIVIYWLDSELPRVLNIKLVLNQRQS